MKKQLNAHLYETKGGMLLLIAERRDKTLGRVIASCPVGGTLKPGPEYLNTDIKIVEAFGVKTRTGV